MFKSAAELGKVFRSEISPMLKSKGFSIRVTTTKKSYYYDGSINVKINKVPTNFPVWVDEYNKYSRTSKANRLLETIQNKINTMISTQNVENDKNDLDGLDIELSIGYDRKIPYIHYEVEK